MMRPYPLLVVMLGLQVACSRGPSAHANAALRPGALRGSNVLLVTIDTLRADRVGAYSGRRLTPALDSLASRGIRFANAHAHAPLTLPAHTSILTGEIPTTHGVHNNGEAGVSASTPTLATLLHDAGYRTGAFVGAFVLDARFGLSRGFDTYDDAVGSETGPVTFAFAERPADRVIDAATRWILARDNQQREASSEKRETSSEKRETSNEQPWFCWIHLFDPHAPYRAPEQRAADPYDNELAFADAQIGRLLDRLRDAHQLDSTLVVVLADHGESLGEHGEATHGLFAYDATLRIPLIIAGPSIESAVSDRSVGQADVLPTILDVLGQSIPSRVDGHSLLPAIRGEPSPPAPVYFEALDAYLTRNWAPLTGVIDDGWKYVDLPEPELYDLASDPGELHNRAGADPSRVAALRDRLARYPTAAQAARASQPTLDPEAAARLRALGYTAGRAPDVGRKRYTVADDPKRLLDVDRRYERALMLTGDRKYGEAATLLQGVLADRPDFIVAYLNLASVFIAGGEPQRAVALLEGAMAHGLTTPQIRGRLGAAYLAAGAPKRAVETLDALARGESGRSVDVLNTLGTALAMLGRRDEARRRFMQVVEESPRSATTWNNLGLLELSAHRTADAARAFERAVESDPQLAQAWQGLGAARANTNPSGAIAAWQHAIALAPRDYDLLFNLAVLLRQEGRNDEARVYAERFVREAPPDRYARDVAMFREWLKP